VYRDHAGIRKEEVRNPVEKVARVKRKRFAKVIRIVKSNGKR